MNKRYCCRTENSTAANNTTAGYQYTWQGAQRSRILPSTLTTDCVETAVLLVLCGVTAARFSVTLSRVLMMCSTAVDACMCSTAGNEAKQFECTLMK